MKLEEIFEDANIHILTIRTVLDRMFSRYNIFTVPSAHFRERLAPGGREENVQATEIANAFHKMFKKHASKIDDAFARNKKLEGVIKDMSAKLNIVFEFDFTAKHPRSNKYTLTLITIMRKAPKTFSVGGNLPQMMVENKKKQKKRKVKWGSPIINDAISVSWGAAEAETDAI